MNNMNPIIDVPSTPVKADTTLPTLCHLLALVGLTGIPFGNVLGPLVLWLLKRNDNPEVDRHGRESLNFQISMTIYLFIAGLSVLIMIGFALFPILLVMNLVCIILASMKANKGDFYRYPLTIRFV